MIKKTDTLQTCRLSLFVSTDGIFLTAFELLSETHFTINMPSVGRLLVYHKWKFFKHWKTFFAFSNVILGVSNTSFDNSMQCMNKMWISLRCNVEKYKWMDQVFLEEKTALHFSHDFQLYNHKAWILSVIQSQLEKF